MTTQPHELVLQNGPKRYIVTGGAVAETNAYRVYLCRDAESQRDCLLQIAVDTSRNGLLDKAAFLLRQLKEAGEFLQAEYRRLGNSGMLSYERLFPGVVDSFIASDQGNRRVLILSFAEVESVRSMVPLSNLRERDDLRIMIRSSAWVMGRLLKLLDFAHGEKIALQSLPAGNILLEPDKHFVVVFDWSSAQTHPEEVPREARRADIVAAARAVFAAIGGDPARGNYPYNTNVAEQQYIEYLRDLMYGTASNARLAHRQFYELIERLWERKFLPFQTLPL